MCEKCDKLKEWLMTASDSEIEQQTLELSLNPLGNGHVCDDMLPLKINVIGGDSEQSTQ